MKEPWSVYAGTELTAGVTHLLSGEATVEYAYALMLCEHWGCNGGGHFGRILVCGRPVTVREALAWWKAARTPVPAALPAWGPQWASRAEYEAALAAAREEHHDRQRATQAELAGEIIDHVKILEPLGGDLPATVVWWAHGCRCGWGEDPACDLDATAQPVTLVRAGRCCWALDQTEQPEQAVDGLRAAVRDGLRTLAQAAERHSETAAALAELEQVDPASLAFGAYEAHQQALRAARQELWRHQHPTLGDATDRLAGGGTLTLALPDGAGWFDVERDRSCMHDDSNWNAGSLLAALAQGGAWR